MASAKPTLEGIITRYRREAARADTPEARGEAPELEVRLQDVDYANFAAIYEGLLAQGPGELTQVVSAIMDAHARRGEGPPRHLRPVRIREIAFDGGRRRGDRYVRKEPLLPAYRVPSAAGIAYAVALSAERADDQGFSSDEGAVIRVKARVSFRLALRGVAEPHAPLEWRADMTVARQIMGSDADTALPAIIGQMFRTAPPMTPQNFLAALHPGDAAAAAALYRYEVEAEFVGPPASRDAVRPGDVTAAAEAILRLANPEYVREAALQAEVYRVAQRIVRAPDRLRQFQHQYGLKRLLPQALAITRVDYRALYPPKGLFLTDKADGRRAVAVVHDGRGAVVSDTLHEYAPAPGAAPARLAPDTIVDGEYVAAAAGAPAAFHAFDVIAVAGEDVAREGFERRLGRLEEACAVLREAGIPAAAKPYRRLAGDTPAELEREIGGVYAAPRPYEADGLIFVEPGKPYEDTMNYKWKPAEHNTIDFLARRAPASVLGRRPYLDRPGHRLHFLFVGVSPALQDALGLRACPGYADLFGEAARGRGPGGYRPVQFAPSDAPLAYLYQHPDGSPHGEVDGRVVEARCAGACAAAGGGAPLADWELVRVREDRRRELQTGRYFGNDFYSAELIWLNYVDPFPLAQLWEGPALDYFMRPKSGAYRAQTAVVSFVKTQRIASLKHADWVVDLGAGKGQDLGRYLDAEVHHLVAVDRDRAALSELVRRKFSFAKQAPGDEDGAGRRGRPPRRATTVHVLVADVGAPYAETLAKLEALGLLRRTADAVVCNLAVHYFTGSPEAMRNFVALARGAVKVGGQVILTVLQGEAVHALFEAEGVAEGGDWSVYENDVRKYSIRRLYSSDRLEAAGQRIGVLLPFSEGQYYEEYLVNTEALAAEFTGRGFSVSVRASVARSIPDFEARNRAVADLLTPGDRQYLALYGELCFVREK